MEKKKSNKVKLQQEEDFARILENDLIGDWSSMPLKMKFKMVDAWSVVIILANINHMIGSAMYIIPSAFTQSSKHTPDIIFGLGTFLLWLSLTMYLQFDNKLNDLPFTVILVFRQTVCALLEILPLLFGLTFFFVSYLGTSWRFNSFQHGVMMLWANWNGDELQNMHLAFSPEYPLICFFVLYFWIWYSNNIITAMFLSIIEDGYVT